MCVQSSFFLTEVLKESAGQFLGGCKNHLDKLYRYRRDPDSDDKPGGSNYFGPSIGISKQICGAKSDELPSGSGDNTEQGRMISHSSGILSFQKFGTSHPRRHLHQCPSFLHCQIGILLRRFPRSRF